MPKVNGISQPVALTLAGAVVVALTITAWWAGSGGSAAGPKGPTEKRSLDRATLDRSLELGLGYLIQSQRPDGRFRYQVHVVDGPVGGEDNQVRQAGALWGLSLIYQDRPDSQTGAAVLRGLEFFRRHGQLTDDGRRLLAYPGHAPTSTGTHALFCLALIEYLRAQEAEARDPEWLEELDRSLGQLVSLRRPDGYFYAAYALPTGRGIEPPNPYFDGESLLALAKAARYLGHDSLEPLIVESAEAMYGRYVLRALAEDPDSDMTKGFYQWGSMSFFELAEAGWPGTEAFARRTVEMAHWQIDVHRTLDQPGNTSYAHEGMVCAAELARRMGDESSAAKIAAVVDTGLARLISWQVGSPSANVYLREQKSIAPAALGGVMNTRNTPLLRIDVTQHQMHAVVLARRHLYPAPSSDTVSKP